MFIQMVEEFPPTSALSILTAQAPNLCAPYLEAALERGSASPEQYHNDLAGIYLRTLLSREKGFSGEFHSTHISFCTGVGPILLLH